MSLPLRFVVRRSWVVRRFSAAHPWVVSLAVGGACAGWMTGCNADASDREPLQRWTPAQAGAPLHPTNIARPNSLDGLDTARTQVSGGAVAIACATCHESNQGKPMAAGHQGPEAFHSSVVLQHGNLACSSCHLPEQPGQLRLASGSKLALEDSMALCSQCHGPQKRNYDHGAHGGMRGYWDLQRGPRERNDCSTCHASHAPKYPYVQPVAGPRDRFAIQRHHPGSLVERRYGDPSVSSHNSKAGAHE